MADRVTQLQDLVMQQAENIWQSISVIENCAEPYFFTDIERRKPKLSRKERLKLKLEAEESKENIKKVKIEDENKNEKPKSPGVDYPAYFANKIAKVAIDINTVIDSLPDDSSLSPDLQVESLKKLEENNTSLSKELEDLVKKGEILLGQIRSSLGNLSTDNLKTFFPE